MVCYLNIYVLVKYGDRVDLSYVIKDLGLEVERAAESRVVPNMFFARIKCVDREACQKAKERVEFVARNFPWIKLEIVCP